MIDWLIRQEATDKDEQDQKQVVSPSDEVNLKSYLSDAYLHPIFSSFEEVELVEVRVDKSQAPPRAAPASSTSSSSSNLHDEDEQEQPHNNNNVVHHYQVGPPAYHQYSEVESHSSTTAYHYDSQQAANHFFGYDMEPPNHHRY